MQKKIRVLHISHFDNYRMGGQKSMLELMNNLDTNRIENFGLTTSEGELTKKFKEMGVKYFVVPLTKLSPNNIFKIVKNIKRIRRICKENQIDIVHSDYERDGFIFGLSVLGTRTKSVWHVRVTRPNNLDKFNIRINNRLICISEDAKKRFREFEKYKNKINVIFNGVNTSIFQPTNNKNNLRTTMNIDENKFIILFVGQMKEGKGIFDLVKSANQLRKENIKFIFIGDFLDQMTLKKWESETKNLDNVEWIGHKKEIQDWMKVSDLLVLPSHEGIEGMGRVIFESMACGTPTIASNTSGVREAITPKSGILFSEKEENEISDAIYELMNNKDKWKRMSIAGRERATSVFDIKLHAENVTKLYVELLNE